MRAPLLLGLTVFLALSAAADTPSQVALRAVERYAAGDLRGFTELWSVPLPPRLEQRLQQQFLAKCLDLTGAFIDAAGNDEVTVELHFDQQDRIGGPSIHEIVHPIVTVVDGRITKWRFAEDELAERIAGEADDGVADGLLASAGSRINRRFLSMLRDSIVTLVDQAKLTEASRALARLRRVAAEFDTPYARSMVAGDEAVLLRARGEFVRSLELSRDALTFAEESQDADAIARALLSLARAIQYRDGSSAAAEPFLQRILGLTDRLENSVIAERAATQLAGTATERGDYRAALRHLAVARPIAERLHDRGGLYGIEVSEGMVFSAQHDLELAIHHLRLAVGLARDIHFANGIAGASLELARCYQLQGDHKNFSSALDEALTAARDAGTESYVVAGLTERGRDLLDRGDVGAADQTLTEAVAAEPRVRDSTIKATALEALAVVRLRQRRYDDALVLATRAEAFEVETGSPDRFDSWLIAAKALRALGRRKEAYAKLEDAMRFAEISREAVAGDEREMRYAFGSRIEAYMDLVGMLVDDGRSMEALEVAERAKGRTLLDLLRSGHLGFPARMTPEESKQDADLSAALVAANRTRLAGGTPAMADQDLARLRLELDSFRVGMAAKYPRLVTERGPEPLGDLSSAAATLPKGVAAFEYVVAEDRICAFRITSNGTALSVAARSIPMGREELARRVEAFSAAVRARDLESRALGADLARRLLSVQDESVFRRASAVLLIPDDALWRMPFEALVTRGDDYVGLIAAIVYTPSLTAWREMTIHPRAKPTAGHELIAFGNPRLDARTRAGATAVTRGIDLGNLPEAETEVHAIARVVGEKRSKVYVGNDVSEERAKRDAPSFNIVHFATHGVFDARNPMYSQIALGRESNDDHEDGLLEAWEIMQLRLSASLVVLSACDTARGEVAAGEGVVGMSWALFAAGSPTTLASQWRVSSAATERLMVRFYREWFALGDVPFAKAKAMQKARAALSRDNRYRRPYYWAPFVLIGSGQ